MTKNAVTFATNYLVPGVATSEELHFHRATLSWDLHHPASVGTLQLDLNTCGLDEFGDTTVCTKMASLPQDMKLSLLKEKPGKYVYAIEARPHVHLPGSSTEYQTLPLRLVTCKEKDHLRAMLLVLKEDKSIERILDLH